MRKLSIFIGIAVIFSTLMMSQAYAGKVDKNLSYSSTIFVPCAGENVFFTGTEHIVIDHNINKSGRLAFKYHMNLMGISGVGVTSGEKYQITEVDKGNHSEDTTDGYPVVFTILQNLHILGLGSGNVYMVTMRWHCTVNANGDLTADIDNLPAEVECK